MINARLFRSPSTNLLPNRSVFIGCALRSLTLLLATICSAGCATVSERPVLVEPTVPKAESEKAQVAQQLPTFKRYKRKIAITRFTNESNYGRALMTDQDYDQVGKQASDMLAAKLVKSGKFMVFERDQKFLNEQQLSGDGSLIGVDVAVVGSVTEFGRSITGKSAWLSGTKVQAARAKVDARVVDLKTGQAFFSASGTGEATTESGEVAGFGSRADYDATLNDRAISAAISDLVDKLVSTLEERPWKTDVLEVQGNNVFISGGGRQGLKTGDVLQVLERGQMVKSAQTGFVINLPPKKVAQVRVVSFFGENENDEGSICELVSGSVSLGKNIYVEEVR